MSAAIAALRAATSRDHASLDGLFGHFRLDDAQSYGRFLSAHAAALLPVETALDVAGVAGLIADWPQRRRGDRLRADLAALGRDVPAPLAAPAIDGPAAAWGVLYVVEGSKLGGALLARSVATGLPTGYLGAVHGPGVWRKFLESLATSLYSDADMTSAAESARAVFALFERAGRRELERT